MEEALLEQLVGQNVGDCHLERLLSYGKVGAVYQAHQLMPNRSVTLTLLLFPEGVSTQERLQFRARFLQEAPRLSGVHHPHLVPLEVYGEWEGFCYLVTPAQPERSLATILRRHGCCAAPTALSILEQITAGLEYAHCRGLVHGALSLYHLLVSHSQQIQIAGLGLQRLLERRDILPVEAPYEHGLTLAGTWLVAQRYLAPECRLGQAADICSDVYALGVILSELLTGRVPWREEGSLERDMEEESHLLLAPLMRHVDLPSSLERVLRQACAADPGKRFQRVSDLLAAFAEGLEEERAPMATACWLCPLPRTSAPVEAPAPLARSQPGQQHTRRFPAHPSPLARRDLVRAHRSRQVSRRRVLGLLMKGGALGAFGASVVSTGYLLTTALLKPLLPQGSGRSQPQQALNTAQVFTVRRDGRQGLLVRLPNGTFVAYERSCTHVGVYVNYNSQTHMLICPAHGAIFDPAHGGRVVQGPATRPLPQVPLRQGSDGTISLVTAEHSLQSYE
jgi:serine/threonine protein kinase/nitrite reductase/ring-hydroxylating ferredoxin subunit